MKNKGNAKDEENWIQMNTIFVSIFASFRQAHKPLTWSIFN